jgi:hypothetical protein
MTSVRLLVAVLGGLSIAGCGLDVSGSNFFPPDGATDVIVPPPVDAGRDVSVDATMTGGHMPFALAAGATVCSSPSYHVVVSLGAGATDESVIESPSYKVVGAVAGVSPK